MNQKNNKLGRRGMLGAFATFGGGLILRSLATGIPARVLLDPLSASADDTPSGKMLILSSSSNGDPFNANVPGTYAATDIFHSADPAMAKLWRWHALEETEHKAVAFDVFQQVSGNKWLLRRAMLQSSSR